jgi:hypothetical protein
MMIPFGRPIAERTYGAIQASLAYKWHKPLSARLLPVAGKAPGELTEFDDPNLVNAKIRPIGRD